MHKLSGVRNYFVDAQKLAFPVIEPEVEVAGEVLTPGMFYYLSPPGICLFRCPCASVAVFGNISQTET